MTFKWWEKTVEYYFILKYFGDSISITPLDGKEESIGDSILSSKNRWLLIEFKKDKGSLKSEQRKFNNYVLAKKSLSDRDNHHFIIYGYINNQENSSRLSLIAQTYFSGKIVNKVKEMLDMGETKQEFLAYLRKLIKFKKKSGISGSGGLEIESYSLVAGINSGGKVTQCMSLYELGHELELGLEIEPETVREQNRPKGQELEM